MPVTIYYFYKGSYSWPRGRTHIHTRIHPHRSDFKMRPAHAWFKNLCKQSKKENHFLENIDIFWSKTKVSNGPNRGTFNIWCTYSICSRAHHNGVCIDK